MDERNEKIISKSMTLVLSIVYLMIVIVALTKYINSGDIESITFEIILLISIPTLIAFFARKNESLTLPRNIKGEIVSENNDSKSKKERYKLYTIGSLSFSLFCFILDLLDSIFVQKEWSYFKYFESGNESINIIISISIDFILSFLIFFILSVKIDEFLIKKYNKKLDNLEEE